MASLLPPVLYVGGGRGTYAAHLQKWLGRDSVTVVDLSPAMARRARADFGLEYVVADVRHLPQPDRTFASVICATGVLEYLDLTDRKTALQEMARVCRRGGLILITAFALPDRGEEELGSHLRLEEQRGTDEHRLLETWFRHYDTLSYPERRLVSAFNAVAREMGDRVAAYHLLKDSLPRYDQRIVFGRFGATISAAGLLTESVQFLADQGIGIWHLVHPDA